MVRQAHHNMTIQHQQLVKGGWQRFSLMEQLGNIGSEVSRALKWQGKDEKLFNNAVDRALELFDLTLDDVRWRGRQQEIGRAREVFLDAVLGGKEYGSDLKDLERYFYHFAYASRLRQKI